VVVDVDGPEQVDPQAEAAATIARQ